jgi:hypothetical protein
MLTPRLRRAEALLDALDHLARRRRGRVAARQLQTAQDVIDLLQEQVEALRHDSLASPLAKARAVGYLVGLARRAIETGKLADRLEMLERVFKQRKEGERS